MSTDDLVVRRAVRGVSQWGPQLRANVALVPRFESVGVHPARALRVADRLYGLVRRGVRRDLRVGIALRVRSRAGGELDQRIHHHRVDGRALTGIEQRVVAGEHAGPALAREEAGVDVRGQEHQPQVVLSAPAGVATPSHPVDLMLDLQIGHAGSDAPGGGALLARRRVGIRIVDRVAGAVRVVGDLVGARPETVGVLRQHREHVVASARVVRDVCEQLLYQLLVRGGAGAGGSVEVIAARRPEDRVDGDMTHHCPGVKDDRDPGPGRELLMPPDRDDPHRAADPGMEGLTRDCGGRAHAQRDQRSEHAAELLAPHDEHVIAHARPGRMPS